VLANLRARDRGASTTAIQLARAGITEATPLIEDRLSVVDVVTDFALAEALVLALQQPGRPLPPDFVARVRNEAPPFTIRVLLGEDAD
jgi:hypothetical protein